MVLCLYYLQPVVGEQIPQMQYILMAMLLGFVAYGLSIFMYNLIGLVFMVISSAIVVADTLICHHSRKELEEFSFAINRFRMEVNMAITVNIYYTGENDNAQRFAEEMVSSGIVDDIRAEDGNIRYDYFIPMNDPSTVLLIDSWESQQAIDIHHASPMMERIMELREKYDLHMKVERYISDDGGIPSSDAAYIKE